MLDLGIGGRKAIVCAASKGLGRACAMALARAGVEVTITARTVETLEEAAAQIRRETGVKVTAAPGDITTEGGRRAALPPAPLPTSWSIMPAVRPAAISANGNWPTGRKRSTPTC